MEQTITNQTCCIFGHRETPKTEEIRNKILITMEALIANHNVSTFFFGSKSNFDDMCLQAATQLKEKYPKICRVYVRAEFPDIDEEYLNYLLTLYDKTYYSSKALNAGRAVYIQRNREIIEESHFCLVYYCESTKPTKRKSGTQSAYEYAIKKNKHIINIA